MFQIQYLVCLFGFFFGLVLTQTASKLRKRLECYIYIYIIHHIDIYIHVRVCACMCESGNVRSPFWRGNAAKPQKKKSKLKLRATKNNVLCLESNITTTTKEYLKIKLTK